MEFVCFVYGHKKGIQPDMYVLGCTLSGGGGGVLSGKVDTGRGVLSGKVDTGTCSPNRVPFRPLGISMTPLFLFGNWFRYRSHFCKMLNF